MAPNPLAPSSDEQIEPRPEGRRIGRMIYSWNRGFPFLALIAIQALVASPLLLYHRGAACGSLLAALIFMWWSVLFRLAEPHCPVAASLVRLASCVSLAAAPFAWYDLRYFHGCRVTLEDSPLLLALVLAGPPLIWRRFLLASPDPEAI